MSHPTHLNYSVMQGAMDTIQPLRYDPTTDASLSALSQSAISKNGLPRLLPEIGRGPQQHDLTWLTNPQGKLNKATPLSYLSPSYLRNYHKSKVLEVHPQTSFMSRTPFSSCLLSFEFVPRPFMGMVSTCLLHAGDEYVPAVCACKTQGRGELMCFNSLGQPRNFPEGVCHSVEFFFAVRPFKTQNSRTETTLSIAVMNDAVVTRLHHIRLYRFGVFRTIHKVMRERDEEILRKSMLGDICLAKDSTAPGATSRKRKRDIKDEGEDSPAQKRLMLAHNNDANDPLDGIETHLHTIESFSDPITLMWNGSDDPGLGRPDEV